MICPTARPTIPLPSWHPNPSQQLLLQACLLPEEKAIQAFAEWWLTPTATRNDPASQRLLPLLWWRCSGRQQGALNTDQRDEVASWKKAMLRTWAHNQRRLSQANQIAALMGQARIPLLLVKGLPLALGAYGHLGLRPMADLDLVVPDAQARQGIEVLTAAGWSPLPTPLKGSDAPEAEKQHPWIGRSRALDDFSELYFRIRNGHGFSHPDGNEADLHWYVFHEQCDPGIDSMVWDKAQSLQRWNRSRTPGVSPLLLMPDPTDHLLLVLSHACRWEAAAPIRWVADAVLLLQAAAPFDWQRFVSLAQQRKLTATAHALLSYLQQQMEVDVPPNVLQELSLTPARHPNPSSITRSLPDAQGGAEEILYLLRRWRRLRRDTTLRGGVPGFSTFVCHILGSPSRRALMRYAFSEWQRRRSSRTLCSRPSPADQRSFVGSNLRQDDASECQRYRSRSAGTNSRSTPA